MVMPYNLTLVAAQIFAGTGTSGQTASPAADQRWPLVEVPHPVDVSAMEVDSYVGDGLSPAAADTVLLGVEDGGADGTGSTDIDTPAGGTEGWTADTPKAHVMSTAASDLDVDDWVNLSYDEGGTPAAFAGIGVAANFIFGIPGGIA